MTSDLHSRQIRLREIGLRGQQRISDSQVTLGTDAASRVAADYLRRSGVGAVQTADATPPREFRHTAHFTHEVTRAFAHGCWLATKALIDILGPTRGTASKL